MDAEAILAYYSRKDVQEALVAFARNREAVGVFHTGAFASRPNTLVYPQDVLAQARQGVIEFHSSVEHWNNPMALDKRIGFDLIFDLDCKHFAHGKIAAQVLVAALQKRGITPSVKFSGNRGFHVGIPWASLPKDVDFVPTQTLFPDIARKVSGYVRSTLEEDLGRALLKRGTVEQLAEEAGKPLGEIMTEQGFLPFALVDVDAVLMSPRHLFRMPYSFNKKSFLISLPIPVDALATFERYHASPARVKVEHRYLENGKTGEADALFLEALDWWAHQRKLEGEKPQGKRREIEGRVPVEQFPPCIKTILAGLQDGKKRALFVLVNFLRSCKWSPEEILPFVREWNQKNLPPIPDTNLVTHIRYAEKRPAFLPPNCTQEGYYLAMNVCAPDHICRSREDIKNPVNYPLRVIRREERQKEYAEAERKAQKRAARKARPPKAKSTPKPPENTQEPEVPKQ